MSRLGPEHDHYGELALAMLTMRVHNKGAIDEAFGGLYQQLWEDARAIDGDEAEEGQAEEIVFLSMLNIAHMLVQYLEAYTGRAASEWLSDLRRDTVDEPRLGDA